MSSPTLTPQILGQAENAHRALLERILARTATSYLEWVALTLTAGGPHGRDQLVAKMSHALKVDAAAVDEAVAGLTAAGLMTTAADASAVEHTDEGRARHRAIRGEVNDVVGRLYSDVPEEDLATAGRVLSEITARADAELASAA